MIQRVQSLWLFLAAMLFAALFIFPIYEYRLPQNFGSTIEHTLGAKQDILLLIIAASAALLSLVGIFFFLNRKKQKNLVWLGILSGVAFIAIMIMKIANIRSGTPPPSTDGYSLPGALIPFVAVLFQFLAIRGIKRDEKLVRSMDRLR